ncbi:MAG: hypothetical protein ACRC2H_04535 [Silanimonas sp.]
MGAALRVTITLSLLLLLTACATGGKLQTAGRTEVLGLQFQTSLDWARYSGPRQETWTIDGTALNQLRLLTGTKPREHVFHLGRERRNTPQGAWFKPGLRPDEQQELLLAALREQGWAEVEGDGLRPARFGTIDGLRFEFTMASQRGLRYAGTAAMFERDGKLTTIYWQAPVEHYHARDAAAVAALIDSIRPI